MRNFKRFLTLALAMVMLVSAFAMGTSAAKFTDVDEENEYLAKAVNLLSYIGVTKGTTETTFGTEELVTREQMAAFIYRLMKKGNSVEGGDNTSAFTDLEDATFFFMVSWANNQGIIKGTSATTFEPKGSITLQDAYTMIVRALGYEKEETLAYPYGYIDVAEAKGVELGEGLDSSVSYTDALTRGDVAILLYNAFFAETGVAETKQVEREIGEGDNATWVLETVTEYPTFCEKYFDVLEVEYQAIATPNYVFGSDETTAELGYEAIEFVYVGEERTEAPAQFYAAYEDLGLDGDANDYIMSHFTMYVILDDDDEIEEILYAEPLMTSKTVTELELGTVTTNTANSYLDADYTVKVLNGKVTVDGDAAYFYGAPYSYATPKYATGWDDAEKYAARNAKNLKFIEFAAIGDVEDGEYAYFETPDVNFEYDENGYNVENAKALIELLKEVYVGGLYEADVYDVDGDGLYDYILYMPYEAYFVNTDDDYTFYDDSYNPDKNEVYTNEAVLAGVEFEDGDYVLGYFDEAANYINVAAVVEPVEGKITAIKKASGMITLNGETKVSVKDGWKTVANDIDLEELNYVVKDYEWNEFDGLLNASVLDEDDDAKFYVYNDVLLYQEGIDSFVKFNDNLLIVTADEEGTISETGAFNSATGKRTTYVHVYVDGETKYVPLNTEAEVYPEYNDEDYVNQLATYSVDGDGLYTIELLGYALDEDDEYVGITWVEDLPEDNDLTSEENDEIQAYGELDEEAYFVKNSTRFSLRDGNVYKTSENHLDFEFYLTDKTVVLVKNTYTDDGEDIIDFIKLGKADIKDTVVSAFTNVKYIVENNVDDDDREFLVLLYAEVNGTEFELKESEGSKKNERIVKMMDVAMNEDGKYYAVYDLFNPYTGAVVENVPGTQTGSSSSFAPKFTYGDVVEISTDDKVMDKTTDRIGNIVEGGNSNANVYLVVEYVASENAVVLAPVPGSVGEDEDLEDAVYAQDTFMVDVSDAKVTIIGHQGSAFNTDMVRWGSLKVADVAKLDGSDKSYLATAKYAEENKPLKTVYAEYVKVYANIDWEDDGDHAVADEETDFNGEANFLVVIANNNENLDLCKLK